MKKLLKLDSFWIRIIALITMTIDHVGMFLGLDDFYFLRAIGRIALPLFIFLTVEGTLKTSNKKKYILRIGLCSIVIGIVLGLFAFIDNPYRFIGLSGNIFLDLLLIILSITILESKNKKIKPLIILPILYSIYCYMATRFEGCGCDGIYYWYFPPLRLQYGFYGLFLGLGFYFAKKIAPAYISKYAPMYIDDEEYQQSVANLISLGFLVVITICYYLINLVWPEKYFDPIYNIQTYAALAGLIILLYNGKRGYNSKWFKIAYYLYYPVHLAIIALIFYIIGV